jgi:hypothetical protein
MNFYKSAYDFFILMSLMVGSILALSIFNNLFFDVVVLMYAFFNLLKSFQFGFALASHASQCFYFILIDRALWHSARYHQ